MTENLVAIFDSMQAEIDAAGSLFSPSEFWRDLNAKNARMIAIEGLDNFKRTVAQNYFNWFLADKSHPFFRFVEDQWRQHRNLLPWITRLNETKHLRFTTEDNRAVVTSVQREVYRLYVCYVWTVMQINDPLKLRRKLSEPAVGNPFPVRTLRGQILSQDLATSIIECNVIAATVKGIKSPRIAEIGAGYGRVANAYLRSLPGQYFIFDIPPALCVSQWYLERTLGPNHVFRFRPFDRFEDVKDEISRASAICLTTNQIQKFPDSFFDSVVSISTLPEMRDDQVEFYLSEMQRVAAKSIFLKQWKTWKNPVDGTDLTIESYRLGSDWRISMDRTDPVIPSFFNRVWSKRS